MPKTLADLIGGARTRSNTERSGFVSDAEIGGYVNDGVKALYDRIIASDDSYYQTLIDFSFTGVTETGASYALPADFYRMRGLTQFPDTPRARPIYAITYADRQRKAGYYLDGNNITVSPYQSAPRGPWRLAYVPKAPQLGVPIEVDAGVDSVVAGTRDFTFANGKFDPAGVTGGFLVMEGCAVAENNSDWRGGWQIEATIPPNQVIVNDPDGDLADETFGPDVTATLVRPALGNRLAEVVTLDVTMDNYDEVPELWAAVRIAQKQRQPDKASFLQGLLDAGLARVDAMATGRQSEPQAAPTLWRPSFDPVNGFGWGGDSGGWDV